MAQNFEGRAAAVDMYNAILIQLSMGNTDNENDLAPPNNNLQNTRLVEYNAHFAEFDAPPQPIFNRTFSDGGNNAMKRVHGYLTASDCDLPTIGQLREHLPRTIESWDLRHETVDWGFFRINVLHLL